MNEYQMKELKQVAAVVIGSFSGTRILEVFREHAPDVILGTQALIGILTIIYLIVKITTHKNKKHERSN